MNRVTCISFVLLGMCLGFPLQQGSLSSTCHAQENQKDFSNRRVLNFPSDQSVGVLRVGRLNGPSVVMDFEELKCVAAKGNIEVSGEDFLELQVGSVDDLDFLLQLSPGALQGLKITGLEINRNALNCIIRMEGLKSLQIASCEFKKDTFEDAKSLPSLRAITVYSTNFDGLTFAGWIATLPKLEHLYASPSLDAIAYQKLSGHPALATTTIDIASDQTEWPLEQLRLPALRELIVNCADNASPRALDSISVLSSLESITISSGTVDGDLLKRIGALGSVRKLQLHYNKMGLNFFEGFETLNSVEQLVFYPSNVRGLNISPIKRQLASSILKLPRIKTIPQIQKPSLQILDQIMARTCVESLDIDEWDESIPIAKLGELSTHAELKKLNLSYVPITDSELQYLSKLQGLEELSLVNTEVQGSGLRLLADLPKFRQLQIMTDASRVKPDLSGLSHLSRLERIQIFGFEFVPSDYSPIADCASLRHVFLSEGKINDALVRQLALLPNLATIALSDSSLTDDGAGALALNQNLENVSLEGAISRFAVAEFAKLPKLSRIFIRSSELDLVDCVDLQFEFPTVGSIRFTRKER